VAGALSGPGVGLPLGQNLYPANLTGGELVGPGNEIGLAPGQALPIPRGRYIVTLAGVAVLQEYDPTTTTWRFHSSSRPSPVVVDSDGFNLRVANLTGCPVAAIVTNAGTNYVQGSTTVTPATGNSTWQAVVGGRIATTLSISNAGGTYGMAPLIFFPPPPAPGVQARAIAVLSSGTIGSITVLDQGAGYATAPVPQIYPNPADPNAASGAITVNAAAVSFLVGPSTLSAILCTNSGVAGTTVPSLTIAGAGTSGAATIVQMFTLTGATIGSGGAGFSANAELSTLGGIPSATPANTNPAIEMTGYIPRKASMLLTSVGGTLGTVGTIFDGGLFAGTPTPLITTQTGAGGSTAATVTLALGTGNASVTFQKVD
jgi:hypothetical protein